MTARELNKLRDLSGLIARGERRIGELEAKLQPGGTSMDGMPHGTSRKNMIEKLVPVIADLREQVRKYEAEQKALEYFINSVEDYHIRSILLHRFVDGLKWNEVAAMVGGGNTEDSVKKACQRFLDDSEKKIAWGEMVNCNDCKNIDFTEQEQHENGLQNVPGHMCMYYNERVFHNNQHRGVDRYIFPCIQCENDNHKHFRDRREK